METTKIKTGAFHIDPVKKVTMTPQQKASVDYWNNEKRPMKDFPEALKGMQEWWDGAHPNG